MRTPTVALLLAALVVSACGGGGGEGPVVVDLIGQYVEPTPSRTGTVESNGNTFVGASRMAAGDLYDNRSSRVFLSFPFEPLPDVELIESVTYVDEQTGVGGAPYAGLGQLVVRSTNLGPVLDASDFDGPAFPIALGTLSTSADPGPRTLDLTDHVLSLLESGADRVDLMITFDTLTDGDATTDMIWLRSAASDEGPGYLRVMRRIPTE